MTPRIQNQLLPSVFSEKRGSNQSSHEERTWAQLLARILQGEKGDLLRSLLEEKIPNLRQALKKLPAEERAALQKITGGTLASWVSLSREKNAELFYAGVFRLGEEAEATGRRDLALRVYQTLRKATLVPDRIRAKAGDRLEVLSGGGHFGDRFEFGMLPLVEAVSDPATLAGMALGGMGYRVGKWLTLKMFVNAEKAGWGIRSLATLGGLGAETLAFEASAKGIHSLTDGTEAWDFKTLGGEMAATALMLGSLRLMGSGALRVYQRLHGKGLSGGHWAWAQAYQQGGMYLGILLAQSLQEKFHLRASVSGDHLLADSLALLVHFNVGGAWANRLLGPGWARLEDRLETRIKRLEGRGRDSRPLGPSVVLSTALEGGVSGSAGPSLLQGGAQAGEAARDGLVSMGSLFPYKWPGDSKAGPSSLRVERPAMGIRPLGSAEKNAAPENSREEMETNLRRLLPLGKVLPEFVAEDSFVSQLLASFNITDHPYDLSCFRKGYQTAQRFPQMVGSIGWDLDEVILHWSFNLGDLFRGISEKGRDAPFHHTPAQALEYQPFQPDPQVRLSWFQDFWFRGIQRRLPSRFRQTIQFHPGIRAYHLGLRLGQRRNLILVTNSPAGRVLLLANEDPAFKMIFFGKLPTQPVTIQEVRERRNLYSREGLVQAMRTICSGEVAYPQDPQVQEYLRRLRENPEEPEKLKDPAIATLLGKRSFRILVDDSGSTFERLKDLNSMVVLRPPSARPGWLQNFTLGSRQSYLDRMSNGYVHDLAELLEQGPPMKSQTLESRFRVPENYPHQRFHLEIPWSRFEKEFVFPAEEMRQISLQIKNLNPEAPEEKASPMRRLQLSDVQLQVLRDRFQKQLEVWLDGTTARAAVHTENPADLKVMALRSAFEFQDFLDRNFGKEEQERMSVAPTDFAKKREKFYSTLAGVLAAKRAVAQLLGLNPAGPLRDIRFHYGRPELRGRLKELLNGRNLLTTQSNDGEVAIGAVVLEPSVWESTLGAIGIDLTTARGHKILDRLGVTSEQHALAEAAYKATYPFHSVRQFNHHRYAEIQRAGEGMGNENYQLSGKTAAAARAWFGEKESKTPFPILGRSFQVGPATAALVALPAPNFSKETIVFNPSGGEKVLSLSQEPPYLEMEDGRFILPHPHQTVVVLGDLGATRTLELAAQGHHPIHIDKDFFYLNRISRKNADRVLAAAKDQGKLTVEPIIQWMEKDWFETTLNADYVEAYFPLSIGDIPPFSQKLKRHQFFRKFIDKALLSKLGPQGKGVFLISEEEVLVEELAHLIKGDSNLELLKVSNQTHGHPYQDAPLPIPLVGGYSGQFSEFRDGVSWLLFRPKLQEPTSLDSGSLSFQKLSEEVNIPFPYQVSPQGRFTLPKEKHEVVVLGDVAGLRTSELVLQGHRVIFIDFDRGYLADSRRLVEQRILETQGRGGISFSHDTEFRQENWYGSRAQAQVVEAYFPIGGMLYDPLPTQPKARKKYLREFLDEAIHTKLGPNPKGVFIITEDPTIARDLATLVQGSDDLNLLDVQFDQPQPLIGGHGFTLNSASWVVYVPSPKSPSP